MWKKTKTSYILALLVLLLPACSTSKEGRTIKHSINGSWTLQSVNVQGINAKFKATVFNEADYNCFTGSSWTFISNNSLGTYTLPAGNSCGAIQRNIRWSVYEPSGEQKQFQFKRLDEKRNPLDNNDGFRLNIASLTGTDMQLTSAIVFEGTCNDCLQFYKELKTHVFMKKIVGKFSLLMAGTILLCSGCETAKKTNKTQRGAAIGVAGGAAAGAVIGNNVGNKNNTVLGAIIGAVVGGVAGGLIGNKMDRQAEAIRKEIPGAEVTRVGEGINVVFNERNPDGSKAGVFFGTNMSNINANSQLALAKLVKVFNDYPETNILIEGHTDDVGGAAYNETLSQKRATTVGNYLTSAGIGLSRLTIKWYGETQPKLPNTSDANRAENRRVEFAITANNKMKEDAAREAANKN